MNFHLSTLTLFLTLLLASGCSSGSQETVIADIQDSHISANAPPKDDFVNQLHQSLAKHFSEEIPGQLQFQHQMLRKRPTQSGVSYPKYYIWIRVRDDQGQLLREGAVRAAGIDTTQLEITNFVSTESVRDGYAIEKVFPQPLLAKIRELSQTDKEAR